MKSEKSKAESEAEPSAKVSSVIVLIYFLLSVY